MTFSVIIPTYRRLALLRQAVESVLHQDITDFELIVVNDGGSDGTDEYLSGLAQSGKVIHLRHDNSGLAATRKLGLTRATGEYVAFTDDDCRVPTDWLSRYLRKFKETGADGIGGSTRTGNPDNPFARANDIIHEFFKHELNGHSGGVPFFTGNNVAYRNGILGRVGGPDVRFRMGAEDRDLVYRLHTINARLVYDAENIVLHFNDARFGQFLRHQFDLGRGSYLYYRTHRGGPESPHPSSLKVYMKMIAYPLTIVGLLQGVLLGFLILTAQIAVAAGFVAAAIRPDRRTAP